MKNRAGSIVILSPFENGWTGRGSRYVDLANKLVSEGWEITYVTSDFDHARKSPVDRSEPSALDSKVDVVVVEIPCYSGNVSLRRVFANIVFSLRSLQFLKTRSYDCALATSTPAELTYVLRRIKARNKVCDVRDIWPDAFYAYPISGVRRVVRLMFALYCNALYRLFLSKRYFYWLVAPSFLPWLKRFVDLSHGRWKFLPLGFSFLDWREVRGIQGDKPGLACYGGGLTAQFDPHDLPDLPGWRVDVYGSGPYSDRWIAKFPSAVLKGVVSRSEFMDAASRADVLLFPSNPFARLPNKAFDYLALGVPVLLGARVSRDARWVLGLRSRGNSVGLRDQHRETYRALSKDFVTSKMVRILGALRARGGY